ncbi:unnamed protein product [Closterium sp. NIES-54]
MGGNGLLLLQDAICLCSAAATASVGTTGGVVAAGDGDVAAADADVAKAVGDVTGAHDDVAEAVGEVAATDAGAMATVGTSGDGGGARGGAGGSADGSADGRIEEGVREAGGGMMQGKVGGWDQGKVEVGEGAMASEVVSVRVKKYKQAGMMSWKRRRWCDKDMARDADVVRGKDRDVVMAGKLVNCKERDGKTRERKLEASGEGKSRAGPCEGTEERQAEGEGTSTGSEGEEDTSASSDEDAAAAAAAAAAGESTAGRTEVSDGTAAAREGTVGTAEGADGAICGFCFAAFPSLSALEQHTQQHHRSLPCPQCNKRISFSRFKRHLKEHELKEQPSFHSCKVDGCSKTFSSSSPAT